MKITVKKPGAEDRTAVVLNDAFILGSDLSCDYVVMDAGIEHRHLSFQLNDAGVAVTNLAQTPMTLRNVKGRRSSYKNGETAVLSDAACLEVADLGIELSLGINNLAATLKSDPKYFGNLIKRPQGVVLIGAALLGTLAWSNVAASYSIEEAKAPEVRHELSSTPTTRAQIAKRFSELGVLDLSVIPAGDTFIVRGFTDTSESLASLQTVAETMPQQIRLQIRSSGSLARQVDAVLDRLKVEVEVKSINSSEVTLGALLEPELETRVRRAIVSDIPGVRSVQFEGANASRVAVAIKGEVLAVWAGDDPYLLNDSRDIVRPGDPIVNDLLLEDVVSPEIIVVSDGKSSWEVRWND